MSARSKSAKSFKAPTRVVSAEIFKQVYDSAHSLPGKEKWVTKDEDVRTIERLLGMPPKTIGAPLWVTKTTERASSPVKNVSATSTAAVKPAEERTN
jgi:hypothetical protein